MASVFVATRDGRPFGTWTCSDADGWRWDGAERGPLIANRVMNVHRRPGYLGQLNLLPDATHAEELSRTWGRKTTDSVELVPVPDEGEPLFVPVQRLGEAPVGTPAVVTVEGVVVHGALMGRVPRSTWLVLERARTARLAGVVAANTPTATIIRVG